MKDHPSLRSLSHPSLPSHPSHALAQKYFRSHGGVQLWPSVFSFTVASPSKSATLKILSKFLKIEHKTSFGSPRSRTDPWPKCGDGLSVCRLAVGYEDDVESLVQSVVELLDRFSPVQKPVSL